MSESEQPRGINIAAGLAWSAIAIVAMLAASLFVWNEIPDDARLPSHWNIRGEVDGHASRAAVLLFAPSIAGLVTIIFALAPLFEPRNRNLAQGRALYHAAWVGVIVLFCGVHATTIAAAFGYETSLSTFLIPTLGLLFAVMGNFMGKTRSNFIMGVRTPWTLSSDYAWEKTHRWLGRAWVVLGFAVAASPFFLSKPAQLYLFTGGAFGSALVAVVISYIYWRNDPARGEHGQ